MSIKVNRPYVIIPKLINQPTWGGTYILDLKGFNSKPFAADVRIGQSYELFSGTKLFTAAQSVTHEMFTGEIGYPDHDRTEAKYFTLSSPNEYISLADLVALDPKGVLGERTMEVYGFMPLLIKINHARGNSFQLHIKPGVHHERWQPKPESWYYLEDGLLTFGLKAGTSVTDYKNCCVAIDQYMQGISRDIQAQKMTLEEGTAKAKAYIATQNPWQYVNVIEAKKYDLIDLSAGGLHHSWEEDAVRCPLGNVIYEVQRDIMDPVSTIRSFDQGKMKSDGSIRPLAIDDFFQFLDTDPMHNDFQSTRRELHGTNALMTQYYAMDVFTVNTSYTDQIDGSFVHLYVRDGEVNIGAGDGMVHLTRGSSCFVPASVGSYTIETIAPESVVLKSYIPKNNP